jgi:hypothetical protein
LHGVANVRFIDPSHKVEPLRFHGLPVTRGGRLVAIGCFVARRFLLVGFAYLAVTGAKQQGKREHSNGGGLFYRHGIHNPFMCVEA